MKADSLSTRDEALEMFKESNELGENNGQPEGLKQWHSDDLSRIWRVLPIDEEERLEAIVSENVPIPPIVMVRVGRDRPIQRLRLDRHRICQETSGTFSDLFSLSTSSQSYPQPRIGTKRETNVSSKAKDNSRSNAVTIRSLYTRAIFIEM
ncbi:hypothetical protein DAPPUDRAFT_255430 [Daphnia pulex]|uniref:Uncharacterized protein n=1 Tax=Daphnia pulex TaxID=6669 RepID=E9H962_DAPPU|nr:hypothetical protein DAPPUDRAFT_255430 [Daphnia pulex]|eukprot:EFX71737.1 hypothetical protein DAPPUDRAFT_255430 [Daphnia pulex]